MPEPPFKPEGPRVREPARSRTVLHVDLDAFYASVELLDDPSLSSLPVVVAGTSRRAVVVSASYEARRFGVRSGMPLFEARSFCPDLVVRPPRFSRYRELGAAFLRICSRTTPLVEHAGLDEAYLELWADPSRAGPAPGRACAAALRRAVANELGLACSVGVASSKLVAKVASKHAKPEALPDRVRPGRGVVEVPAGEEAAFLAPMPVSVLPGAGPKTVRALRDRFGVVTVGELAAVPVGALVSVFGRAVGARLAAFATGRDDRPLSPARAPRSVSCSRTFPVDLVRPEAVDAALAELAGALAAALARTGRHARSLTVSVRTPDFVTKTRSGSLHGAGNSKAELLDHARRLIARLDTAAGVRLLGLTASRLDDPDEGLPQPSLPLGLAWGARPKAASGQAPRERRAGTQGVGVPRGPKPQAGRPAEGNGGQAQQDAALERALAALARRYGAGIVRRGLTERL